MASTFTLKSSSSYDGRYLQLTCTQTKDIATNKSTIKWTLSSIGGSHDFYSTGATSVTINGVQVYYSGRTEWNTEKFPAAKGSTSGTITVDHDGNGNKSISVSMSTAIYYGTVKTDSGTWVLDNIPRYATLLTAPDFNDTQKPTITYKNDAGNNVTILEACISDNSGREAYVPWRSINKTGTLSYTFTDADMTALKNITGNSLKVWFLIHTQIGGVDFWEHLERTFTMTENADTKPSVSMSVTLNNASLPSKFAGMCIQGRSRLDVSLSASGKYNAGINSYYATMSGKTYNSSAFTTDAIASSGSVQILGYARDSRGFTGSASSSVTAIEYQKPSVIPIGSETAILCYRSDGNGKRVGESTSVWIKAKRSYYKLSQKNSCRLQWRWKLSTDEWDSTNHPWSNLLTATDTSDEFNALIPNVVFDLKKSYTVQIKAEDDIGENDTRTLEIPTRDVALHLGKGGKNVSVGTYCDYSEDYTFYSDWKAIFDKDLLVKDTLSAKHIGKIDLYDSKDFDDLIYNTGYYTSNKSPLSAGCSNYPSTLTGVLEVISRMEEDPSTTGLWGFAWQTYRTYTGDIYTRSYYSETGWTSWKQMATT